ncbi:MAG: aminodeoxychorismate/anthranilate synthase component II [Hyphomicrobiales bacterium]
MITLIDNYDSFTYNLLHYLAEMGGKIQVYRNDRVTVERVLAENPQAIVLSPGPSTPNEAGLCLNLIRAAGGLVPLLGVCLGHQAIGQAYGGRVVCAPVVMHGKRSRIFHSGRSLFHNIDNGFRATRYHSLSLERETFPNCLEMTAETEEGVIMGLSHRDHEIHGVQFHPESIASEQGHRLLKNFLRLAKIL